MRKCGNLAQKTIDTEHRHRHKSFMAGIDMPFTNRFFHLD